MLPAIVPRSLRAKAIAALAGLTVLAAAGPLAAAHHGFGGRYDRAAPLYLEGVVVAARHGYPHTELLVAIDGAVAVPPALLPASGAAASTPPAAAATPPAAAAMAAAPLSDEQIAALGGPETLARLAPFGAAGEELELVLPPPMTAEVSALPNRPEAGDRVGAVAFAECDTGELRVQLLLLEDGTAVARGGPVQAEVEGCDG
jgi:hypothetical protein